MQYEKIIEGMNDLYLECMKRRDFINSFIYELETELRQNERIYNDEIDDMLNFIALMILNEKGFKFGKTQTTRGAKLFEQDGELLKRRYKRKTMHKVTFLRWRGRCNDVYDLLPDNFKKLVDDIAINIEEFNENGRSYEIIKTFDVDEELYCDVDDNRILSKIKIKIIELILKSTYLVIRLYGENYTTLRLDRHLVLMNDNVYNTIKDGLKHIKKQVEEITANKNKAIQEIYDLMKKYGFEKYMVLRGV